MELNDEWLAGDKLQHAVACLFIAVIVSLVVSRSRHRFLRRWSTRIGCLSALAAGAAKEAADELGFMESAGASFKDAAADLIGVLLAAILLSFRPPAEKILPGGDLNMV
ncbi:uncharacterized protein LOC144713210 [Wolffia australiana]